MRPFLRLFLTVILLMPLAAKGDEKQKLSTPKLSTIGYIGSLSGFAGTYGTAVLEGARLAVDEINAKGGNVKLIVEDDQSQPRNFALAYQKLSSVNHIQALITGSWWANSIVKTVERDLTPFISCETPYDKDFITAPNYFSLDGDLRDWVRVFEPIVAQRRWLRAAMVKFISGFADTIKDELQEIFAREGREFTGAFEYSDLDMHEAPTLAAQVKALAPDVLYIDGQPASFAQLMRHLTELHVKTVIFANMVAHDAYVEKLFSPSQYEGEIFYNTRATAAPEFTDKFQKKYSRPPVLNADMGYYAVHILDEAFAAGGDPIHALKSAPLVVDGIKFRFDRNNVYRGAKQEVFTFKNGVPVKVLTEEKPLDLD